MTRTLDAAAAYKNSKIVIHIYNFRKYEIFQRTLKIVWKRSRAFLNSWISSSEIGTIFSKSPVGKFGIRKAVRTHFLAFRRDFQGTKLIILPYTVSRKLLEKFFAVYFPSLLKHPALIIILFNCTQHYLNPYHPTRLGMQDLLSPLSRTSFLACRY